MENEKKPKAPPSKMGDNNKAEFPQEKSLPLFESEDSEQDVEQELSELIKQNETQASAYKKILKALKDIQDSQKPKE